MSAPTTTRGATTPDNAGNTGEPWTTGGTGGTGTSPRLTRRNGPQAPRAVRLVGLVDGLAVLAFLVAAMIGLGPAWGTASYLLPALGGALVGLGVAWLGAWRRWPAISVAAVTVVAYLLLGGALALRGTTLGGVLPTLTTFRELLLGAVTGWKGIVTTVPPLQSFPDLAVVPYLLFLVAGVLTGTIAWRARRAAWALLPAVALLVGVILLGTIIPALPLVQGLVLGVVGLLWASWRVTEQRMGQHPVSTEASRAAVRRLRWHRARAGAGMLAVGALAAVLLAPMVTPGTGRTVLREEVVPPLDLHEYVSPLMSFRKYTKDMTDTELFTVRGLPEGARVRLATLDEYSGVVYDASTGAPGSGVFTRAGDRIATLEKGTRATLDIEVTGYEGYWMPDAGYLAGISFSGERAGELADSTYYNSTTGTALATAGLRPGDVYRLEAIIAPQPTEEDLRSATVADVEVPQPSVVPQAADAKGEQFMGSATDPVERLFNLRDGLEATGIYSSGLEDQLPSRPGHSAERIETLLAADEMIGDDEQFAVALALMANKAGIPARVVMGFYPDEGAWEPGQPYIVTGGDVHAWAEIAFEGYGWVPVDAVPDEDNQVEPEPRSDPVPKPPVLEDPEPPEEPADAESGTVDDEDAEEDADADEFDWGQLFLVSAIVAIPLVLLAIPIIAILLYKGRRRARRREAERPVDRISGGWREVLDNATDLGTGVPAGATRREGAGLLSDSFPSAQSPTTRLAHRADATVFGSGEPSDQEIAAFWDEVDGVVTGMRSTVNRRQRIRAALSLRSVQIERFRRRPGTPSKGS
ncbi:transglutaminase-like domain-containing protein [Oerskovia flava]|uniref:transglutaminase-like domain-containing protein n=1 Tax=Oerskovia flava TaxID=2986422 RepID=UPI002240C07C|nr:transglutaminase-like domain-containing protein [Oerskovia sp. JB1-3-2]